MSFAVLLFLLFDYSSGRDFFLIFLIVIKLERAVCDCMGGRNTLSFLIFNYGLWWYITHRVSSMLLVNEKSSFFLILCFYIDLHRSEGC